MPRCPRPAISAAAPTADSRTRCSCAVCCSPPCSSCRSPRSPRAAAPAHRFPPRRPQLLVLREGPVPRRDPAPRDRPRLRRRQLAHAVRPAGAGAARHRRGRARPRARGADRRHQRAAHDAHLRRLDAGEHRAPRRHPRRPRPHRRPARRLAGRARCRDRPHARRGLVQRLGAWRRGARLRGLDAAALPLRRHRGPGHARAHEGRDRGHQPELQPRRPRALLGLEQLDRRRQPGAPGARAAARPALGDLGPLQSLPVRHEPRPHGDDAAEVAGDRRRHAQAGTRWSPPTCTATPPPSTWRPPRAR